MSEIANAQTADGADRIEITVPLRTEFFATLRTMAASLGADAGFSIDEIDDLRLGISEVVGSFAADPSDRIRAQFDLGHGRLVVSISSSNATQDPVLDELATGILNTVVDRCEIGDGGVTLTKHASEATQARSGSSDA